jgi:nickel-dependent lactate racemase
MNVHLAYGQGSLAVDLPDGRTTIIEPSHRPGLSDERAAVLAALEQPTAARPLRDWLKPGARVCINFTDITRATPNDRLLPWILGYLERAGVERDQITLLNQTGTHRANTRAELEKMLGAQLVANYRVLNHDCERDADLVPFGATRDGTPALINRHCAHADVRIITGFIEPHFFAGFSGGPKGIVPGVGGLRTIMSNHGYRNLLSPNSTFGVLEGNPLWEELMDIALRVGPSFLLNVTLNDERRITNVFAGDLREAHRAGCDYVRKSAMQRVKAPFDVVVTTNSGYPLDQNLYQGVKGMSAAARIVREGGLIVLACECREGVPAGSPLDKLLRSAGSPEEILAMLATPGFVRPEQWQAQIQALILRKARVLVYSSLPDDIIRAAHLTPCHNIAAAVNEELARCSPDATVAALPQGPLTIPYLA